MKKFFADIQVEFDLIRDGDQFVAYCKALDLATQGDTVEQAHARAKEILEAFIEETTRMGTTREVLEDLGWRVVKKGSHPATWIPPRVVGHLVEPVRIPIPA